jgi:hypothetical protein
MDAFRSQNSSATWSIQLEENVSVLDRWTQLFDVIDKVHNLRGNCGILTHQVITHCTCKNNMFLLHYISDWRARKKILKSMRLRFSGGGVLPYTCCRCCILPPVYIASAILTQFYVSIL